jgi:hypothetical protein
MSIFFENFSPSRLFYLSPRYNISFDIVSDGDPIDLYSINVSFKEPATIHAIINGIKQPGFVVTLSSNANGGYYVSVIRTTMQPGSSITMDISADTDPSSGPETLQRVFTTADYTGTIGQIGSFGGALIGTGVESPTSSYSGNVIIRRNNNILFQQYNPGETIVRAIVPVNGWDPDASLVFDWLGVPFGDPPDITTLDVTLRRETIYECVTDIRDDVAMVDSIPTSKYTSQFEQTISYDERLGYRITLNPEIPFNDLETVIIKAYGNGANCTPTISEATVLVGEKKAPDILNFTPADGSTGVNRYTSISFDIHDNGGSGVELRYLKVLINDDEAVVDGVAQTGYTLTTQEDSIYDTGLYFGGYNISISREEEFLLGEDVAISINGSDAYGNYEINDFSFTIEEDTEPPYYEVFPENGSTGVSRYETISLTIRDYNAVVYSSINLSINSNAVVSNGIVDPEYSVVVTELENGYTFVIQDLSFDFAGRVNITASAADLHNNASVHSSYFIVYSDTTSPSILDVTPRDGQEEVSIGSDFSFTIRDGYDVDLDTIDVWVDGRRAVNEGRIWFKFGGTVARMNEYEEGEEPGNGYAFFITQQDTFAYNSTVDLVISAYDSVGNHTYETITWGTVTTNPPLFDSDPGSNETNVDVDTDLIFSVYSDGYDIDISSLKISLNDREIVTGTQVLSPDFSGEVIEVDPGTDYDIVLTPRLLLDPNSTQTIIISASEVTGRKIAENTYKFTTGNGPENPKVVYVGSTNGVQSIMSEDLDGFSNGGMTTVLDGYSVNNIYPVDLNYINKLAISTKNNGVVLYSTNYDTPTISYSVGDEIQKSVVTTNNNGTLYALNRTKERVDVFYNLLYDDADRTEPDAYYGAEFGIDDGYFTDIVVTEETSTIESGSNSIFIGTSTGVFRIETDESDPSVSETNGSLVSYGISGSMRDYQIIESTTNFVVSVDVNTRLNHLYVATRSESNEDTNSITYIDMSTNEASGSISGDRLMHRLINDISFSDTDI